MAYGAFDPLTSGVVSVGKACLVEVAKLRLKTESPASKVQRFLSILRDPSQGNSIRLDSLQRDLKSLMSVKEISDVTQLFRQQLVTAATTNPFGQSNLNHVSLHYRDLVLFSKDLERRFCITLPVSLMNVSAHDLGKVAHLNNQLSAEAKSIRSQIEDVASRMQNYDETGEDYDCMAIYQQYMLRAADKNRLGREYSR